MLTQYIENLIKKANYEILDDDTYYGEIPGVDGVWANEETRGRFFNPKTRLGL